MPKRYQNGKLLIREDVSRPYYYVKVSVPTVASDGRRLKRRVEEHCGFTDEVSRDEAMRRRAIVLESVNNRRRVASSLMKFRDLTARYLASRAPVALGVAARARYKNQIKVHLDPYFGEMKLSEIDKQKIEEFLALKTGLSWWSKIGLKGILSALFTAAKDWGFFEGDNPTQKIRLGKKKAVYQKKILTAEQFRVLLAGADVEIRFLIIILFGVGLRISEALALRWEDIDFQNSSLRVVRRWHRGDLSEDEQLKSDASVSEGMPLSTALLAVFAERRKPAGFIFIGDDGVNPPDDRDWGRERLRPLMKRLGIYTKGNLWHTFRRTYISWMQSAGGATPFEAQRAARHASLDMTFLYTQNEVERERSQQQAMFDKLLQGEATKQ